jgi:cyanophycin synthetase
MKIMQIHVLCGPNVWSVRHKQLIEMLLDLQALEYRPSNEIPGFYERLTSLMPSLYKHHCSEGTEGGFLYRVRIGTWMGHIIEHIALELQTLADMDNGFGRTRGAGTEGVYHVVFGYQDPEAGIYAAQAAVRIAEALVHGEQYDLEHDIEQLTYIWNRNKLGPSTASIVEEATRRGIPFLKLDNGALIQLGYGKNQQRIDASLSGATSAIAVDIASDKDRTKNLLYDAMIPVPEGHIISNEIQLKTIIEKIGFPVVIKPLNGNHGKGATTNIIRLKEAIRAMHRAKRYSDKVICEKFITGFDYRILLINYKFTAAALRTPACITGDGNKSIRQLIDILNSDARRGNEHDNILTRIQIDQVTLDLLKKNDLHLDAIPADGQIVYLKPTANLSTGGTAEDVTEFVHPDNIALFERAARLVGLDICGIDVMAPDLSSRLQDNGGAILEINAAPGLRMHLSPSSGKPRNVARPIVDMLFPAGSESRIPIIAITGTNGKTTTTRIVAHLMKTAGFFTGFTSTDGIYLGNEMVEHGDCSGPSSARMILKDPAVEVAVLECARGGMLRSGLGFDTCDVGIVTNVAEDHLGLGNINTLEQLAHVKAIVAEAVHEDGTAILNADDDLVYGMKYKLKSNLALFTLHQNNPKVHDHILDGGLAAVFANNCINIYRDGKALDIISTTEIPCTFNGKAEFNVANVMAATLAAIANGLTMDTIRTGLRSFENSVEQTPGRLNLFDVKGAKVLLDYAHNPHGLKAVGQLITSMDCRKRVGIVTGVGDRRDRDIIAMGEESARIFDEIIIRVDNDLRGRCADEIMRLLMTGIKNVDSNKYVRFFENEDEAIDTGFNCIEQNDLLVMFVDDIWKSIERIRQHMNAPVHELEATSTSMAV